MAEGRMRVGRRAEWAVGLAVLALVGNAAAGCWWPTVARSSSTR